MEFSRGGYYQWLVRKPRARANADDRLGKRLVKLHHHHREAYGTERLCRELHKQGIRCGQRRIAGLKRNLSLWTKRWRRFVFLRHSDSRHARYENLLRRRFRVNLPNRVWLSDVTCVWTMERWLYIAVVIDLYSRRVIGWFMGTNAGEVLTLALSLSTSKCSTIGSASTRTWAASARSSSNARKLTNHVSELSSVAQSAPTARNFERTVEQYVKR
jgi:transposase InsO family protein